MFDKVYDPGDTAELWKTCVVNVEGEDVTCLYLDYYGGNLNLDNRIYNIEDYAMHYVIISNAIDDMSMSL